MAFLPNLLPSFYMRNRNAEPLNVAPRLGGKTPLGVYRALKASSPQGYDAKKELNEKPAIQANDF